MLSGPHASPSIISGSLHLPYFKEYFKELDAQTTLIEHTYIDRDFLEDFASYYVRCFTPYEKICRRIHFFDKGFSQADFEALIAGEKSPLNVEKLQDAYLGFIVLKPLPETVIGRTCLKPYKPEGRRFFPVVRRYEIHLCGFTLNVESIAFQEQDKVTSACATSALWSVFHGTSKLYQHRIPSPVEITKLATKLFPPVARVLPNTEGLNIWQMAHAIRAVDLEPIAINANDPFILRAYSYAYMRSHTPAILNFSLIDWSSGKAKLLGHHAVALTGYSLPTKAAPTPIAPLGTLLTSSKVDKLYAHDDGIGPFARMEFEKDGLTTSWRGKDGKVGSVKAEGAELLIPVYHKVRISFRIILNTVMDFDALIQNCRKDTGCLSGSDRLEWDIYLTTVNEIKKSIRNCKHISPKYRLQLLQEHMPRFLWRAKALLRGEPVIDLLFDATDIEKGNFFFRGIEYNVDLSVGLRAFKPPRGLQDLMANRKFGLIFGWLRENPLT